MFSPKEASREFEDRFRSEGTVLMRSSSRYLGCAVFLFLTIGVSSSHAAWVENGIAVCAIANKQDEPLMVSDGSGGAIVAWLDYRSGNPDVYAQRLDGNGHPPRWTTNGVAVCNHTSTQANLQMVADGTGGAVLVWDDNRNGTYDIYAQRMNGAGGMEWAANGVAVCTAAGDQVHPRIVSSGSGWGIITWQDGRGSDIDLRAQRFNSKGEMLWTADGISICAATGNQTDPAIVSDGSDGACIAWMDGRGSDFDICAQRVASTGETLWRADGALVCGATGNQFHVAMAASSSGVIAVWADNRPGYGLYAQRISSAGYMLWHTDGVPICTGVSACMLPKIVPDGSGGDVIVWVDGRDHVLYAQRVQSNGGVVWTENGVRITGPIGEWATIATHDPFDLVSIGSGETIVTWCDLPFISGSPSYVRAQRVSAAGAVFWTSEGVTLASSEAQSFKPRIVPDGSGQFIVAWPDNRNTVDFDIYAQMIGANSYWGNQTFSIDVGDVRGDQGGWARVTTQRTLHDAVGDALPITGYCVWRKRAAASLALEDAKGATDAAPSARETIARILADPEHAAGTSLTKNQAAALAFPAGSWEALGFYPAMQQDSYDFIVPTKNDSSGAGIPRETFLVSAHTPSPSNYILSQPDSGYSVDNLAPGLVHGLAGEQKYVPAGLELAWHPNTEHDLAHYAVYRGTSAGFVPGPSNLVASPTDTAAFDGAWRWSGGYYYKVSAIDRHGNESGFALLTPDGVTGTETPKAPDTTYLAQNFPNPFNPTTRITFGLKAPATVSLRIYDAAGRLVRILVAGSRPAGNYSEIWDGRDNGSRSVASGIYFYRLDAGSFSQTRKMALLR